MQTFSTPHLLEGKPTYQSIVDTFGTGILDTEAQIDRKKLGRIVFKIHCLGKTGGDCSSAVIEMINTLLKATKSHLFVVEAVKLIELAWQQAVTRFG